MATNDVRKVAIIGAGAAGYTAAIYTARANLSPIVFAGPEPGGQLTLTTMVENFPGFAEGVMGPELMEEMRKQAERFGAEVLWRTVGKVDFSQRPFVLEADGDVHHAAAVIIASGASAKMLGLESERRLLGHGVSTCATCDGAFFRDQNVVVVGGGDTAMEDATFLTKFAKKVSVIHRRDELRASKIMQERARKNPKIDFVWNTVVEEIRDPEAGRVNGVVLRNVKNDERLETPIDGVFVAIGHKPNTEIFRGQIDLDEVGYITTQERTMTNVEGVFAAGDVVDFFYRQAVTAAGDGCRAAIDAEKWLGLQE